VRQRTRLDHGLRLQVVARDDVADRAQRGRLDDELRVRQQLDDALDLVSRMVRIF
jgi:hypothetical protein